jgi:hypothetical protein
MSDSVSFGCLTYKRLYKSLKTPSYLKGTRLELQGKHPPPPLRRGTSPAFSYSSAN